MAPGSRSTCSSGTPSSCAAPRRRGWPSRTKPHDSLLPPSVPLSTAMPSLPPKLERARVALEGAVARRVDAHRGAAHRHRAPPRRAELGRRRGVAPPARLAGGGSESDVDRAARDGAHCARAARVGRARAPRPRSRLDPAAVDGRHAPALGRRLARAVGTRSRRSASTSCPRASTSSSAGSPPPSPASRPA